MGVSQSEIRKAGELRAEAALIDVDAVARMLSCSTEHVRRLSDAGRMPAPRKLGRSVRWSRSEIIAWIDDGCPDCRRGSR